MGCLGDMKNPELINAIDKVLKSCQKHNIVAGIVTGSAEEASMRIKQGFKLVTIMNDLGFFKSQSKNLIDAVRRSIS